MNQALENYYASLAGKKVYFLGAGISHRQLFPLFVQHGAAVTLCDKKSRAELGEYGDELEKLGVGFRLGEDYLAGLDEADIVNRILALGPAVIVLPDQPDDDEKDIETFGSQTSTHLRQQVVERLKVALPLYAE